jgi:hypothetical protein
MIPVILLRNSFSTTAITRCHGNAIKQQKSFTFTPATLPAKVTNEPECNFLLFYGYLCTRCSIFQTINPSTPELNPSTQRRMTRFFTGDFTP